MWSSNYDVNMKLIIEIGTNSTKTVMIDGSFYLDERVYSGRIGEGLFESNRLSETAIERNISILREIFEYYKVGSRKLEVGIAIIATQALRSAMNCDVFCDKVMELFGVGVHVLSPEEEAICAFYSQYPVKNDVVLDIGGGSTEVIVLSGSEEIVYKSYPVGAVYLKDLCCDEIGRFDSADGFYGYVVGVLRECMAMGKNPPTPLWKRGESLTGIGGTFVALAMIKKTLDRFQADKIEGTELNIDEIREIWCVLYSGVSDKYSVDFINEILKDRADIMIYGVGILLYVMNELGIEKVAVSCRGVRHGYFVHKGAKR